MPTYPPIQPAASIPAVQRLPYWRYSMANRNPDSWWQRIQRFFHSPGGSLRWRTWWLEVLNPMQFGALIGIGLSFLVLLMFWYPVAAGYAGGVIAAGLILALTFFIARFLYGLVLPQGQGMGILVFLLGAALAAIAGFQVTALTRTAFSASQPEVAFIFLDGLLVGALGGISYGSYRVLARFKSKALALAASLALGGIPLFLIWAVGLFSLPFRH
jgi:hypothetical protein